ncbi:MAG TPA: hypothetical protein V6D47_18475 [Oscillatoriaceae cyanobacterium]
MPEGQPASLNPVPRSLLDQFLQELHDLGLSARQVDGHLVYLRLWQMFLAPAKLLAGTPDDLARFEDFLRDEGLAREELQLATEAVEHFYAFTLDRLPNWAEHESWLEHLAVPAEVRSVPLWRAIARKFTPHLRKVDPGLLRWDGPGARAKPERGGQ